MREKLGYVYVVCPLQAVCVYAGDAFVCDCTFYDVIDEEVLCTYGICSIFAGVVFCELLI